MKRGVKVTLIILGIIALLIGLFFLARYQYGMKISERTTSIFESTENYNQDDWKSVCENEEGVTELLCFLSGYVSLTYQNKTVSEAFCREISPEKVLPIEKVFFPEFVPGLQYDAKSIREDCILDAKTN